MQDFQITYEVVTEFSAEHGEAEELGYVLEDVTLREALDWIDDELGNYSPNGYVEANCYPVIDPRWFTFYCNQENGVAWRFSLHLPSTLTEATRQRIARHIGCQGIKRR